MESAAVPLWVKVTFAALVAAMLGCLGLAFWLGVLQPQAPKKTETVAAEDLDISILLQGPTEVPLPYEDALPVEPVEDVSAAVVKPRPAGGARIALVIDDMGVEAGYSARALEVLPKEVTLAFLPYGRATLMLAKQARERGHELLVHVPMEPEPHDGVVLEMGPHGLKVGMAADEIERELMTNLKDLRPLVVGVNNHMGSRFTTWESGMRVVLAVLRREGLLFLDSKTSAATAVPAAAAGMEMRVLTRDVFLDHEPESEKVRAQWRRAVELAKKRGFVIVIGHPLPVTLEVLAEELPRGGEDGVALVPISAVMER